jgi:RNA polymerase sigma-70 factor (ECF subfamily)
MTPPDPGHTTELLRRYREGDPQALAELFAGHRERLRRMVRLRLDRRLLGQVDPSEVLRGVYLELGKQAAEYAANPAVPFYLWLRQLAGQRLVALHRQHLGARAAEAGQEVSLYRGALPRADSASLAAQLLGRLTAGSQSAVRAQMQIRLQEALNSMDALDREILVLRHFEELGNGETAAVLGISKSAASDGYVRALKRLKDILAGLPGA